MFILSFIIGSLIAFIVLAVIMITSSAKAKICKAEYVNQLNQIGNSTSVNSSIPNLCEENSLIIQRNINELVKARYPTCGWIYDGNKMDLPFLDFIDVEVITQEGTHLLTERLARNDNNVEHCEAF